MGIARWFFEWQRDFRHFRWYYNSRRINTENGRDAVDQLLALSKRVGADSLATSSGDGSGKFGTGGNNPQEQIASVTQDLSAKGAAPESVDASPNSSDTTLGASKYDSTVAKCEDFPMPADLNEIRQVYEGKVIDDVDRFRRRAAKTFGQIETLCEKGITNISLLRHDLFSYLRTYGLILRYKILVWILFGTGLLLLTMLDVAPTLLVFEGLMEGDTVSIGRMLGISDEEMRDLILGLATVGFLAGVVMMGHIVAKLIAATYLDGEVPAFGIGLALVMLSLFVTVAGLRYQNEVHTQEENYAVYVKDYEKKLALGTATTKELLTIDQWKPGYMGQAAFRASMFVLISLMIFISAVYLSLWRVYGDVRMITRRFKHIRYRVKAATLSAGLRAEHNTLINRWEKLRQSAQVEVEQFMTGVERGMANKGLSDEDRQKMQRVMRHVAHLFNQWLQLPEVYRRSDQVTLPASEEEWGMRYGVFLTEAALFEAFSKGAMDAFNHGVCNPDSVLDSIADHLPVGTSEKLLPGVTAEEMECQYKAGFIEGKKVPNSPASLHQEGG